MKLFPKSRLASLAILIVLGIGLGLSVRALVGGFGARPLNLSQAHERTIAPGKVHTYTVTLSEGRFAYVAAEQRGVDVVLRVLGPEGDTIMIVDSPNGQWGVEPVYFTDREPGEYTILVSPLRPEAAPGRYRIALTQDGPTATTPEEQVRQLFIPWDREGYPGASIAVTRNGETVFADGFGEAQLEYGIPITSSTIFPVASVSKQFTAFAIALLVTEGRLSLDDDIRQYLPEIPDFGETITIEHLVYHTSGLRNWWTLLPLAGWRRDDVFTHNQVLRLIANQRELNFSPGEEREYSNTGYTLLASIVARTTGRAFGEWMEETVFHPLGMMHTHFNDDPGRIVLNRAYSYLEFPSGRLSKAPLNSSVVGATGLFTTSEDLARWMASLADGKVGGQEVVRLMQEKGSVLSSGDSLEYAMGLNFGEYRGLRTLSHSGSDAGFRTYSVWFPDEDLSVNVLSNVSTMSPSRMALAAAAIFLEGELGSAGDQGPDEPSYLRGIEQGEQIGVSRRSLVPIDPSLVEMTDYEGRFFSRELGAYYDLVVEDGILQALHLKHDPILLIPIGADVFTGGIHFFVEALFERDAEDRVTTMLVSSAGVRNLRFEKVDW